MTTYISLANGETIIADGPRAPLVDQYRAGAPFIRVTKAGSPVTIMTAHIVYISDVKIQAIVADEPA